MVLDELLKNYSKPEDLIGPDAGLKHIYNAPTAQAAETALDNPRKRRGIQPEEIKTLRQMPFKMHKTNSIPRNRI